MTHERAHLTALDKFCGLVKYKRTMIVLPRCPFCLGENWIHEDSWPAFQDHIREHVRKLQFPTICPHPLCCPSSARSGNSTPIVPYHNKEGLFSHILEVHQLNITEDSLPRCKQAEKEVARLRAIRAEDRTKLVTWEDTGR